MSITDYMTTREEATFIWLAIAFLACSFSGGIRRALIAVARSLVAWKILLPLLLFMGIIWSATWLMYELDLWNRSLSGAVGLWFLFSGFKYFINVSDVPKQDHFFREKVVELIRAGAFFEFFLGIRTFSLYVELPMVFLFTLLSVLQIVAESKEESRPTARALRGLLGVAGIVLLTLTVENLVANRSELEVRELVSLYLVPIWLTVVTLPFIYLLALVSGYELLFVRMRFAGEQPAPWRVRLGVMLELRASTRDIKAFAGRRLHDALSASSLRGAREAVRSFRADTAARLAVEASARQRLIDNAGVTGTDEDGRRLDQREFEETQSALRWPATCQMGWYRREDDGGYYRADLLERLGNDFTRQGLPPDSGIVMRVRKDGQVWYAYRRTVTGWVFAIGASEDPPSQWLFDGHTPPQGFPGTDRSWGVSMFDTKERNWF